MGKNRVRLILKRISFKGIKLSLIAKKDKLHLKTKGLKTRTSVGYQNLNIDDKKDQVKDASQQSWRTFVSETKTLFKKPVRHVTHIGLVMVILIVLFSAIPAPKVKGVQEKTSVDPFGIQKMTVENDSAGDKVTSVEAVATIASVMDDKMAEDAFQAADTQAAKTQLAVSGNAIAKLAVASSTSSSATKATFQQYAVQDGDTLWSIARQFGVTTDSIKWSNGITDENFVKPGQTISIPSITGIIYTVKEGDTLEGIAGRFKASAAMIESQNDLYGEEIKPGMLLIIPDGSIDEPDPEPEPAPAPAAPAPTRRVATSRTGLASGAYGGGSNRFPWGYCTWWVSHKRSVPWSGNANQWYYNAQAYGRPVGRSAIPGAIMVTWESGWGHVAYVESVSGGSFTVSEMNYAGYGVVSSRTISTSSVPLIGFIY